MIEFNKVIKYKPKGGYKIKVQSKDFYQQENIILQKEWILDWVENTTTIIERQGEFIDVPVNELQKGDILLDYLTDDREMYEGSKIDLLNLAVIHQSTPFVKIGEVVSSEIEKVDIYFQKIKIEYLDNLSEIKIDKNLVQKEQELFSLKDMYYSSEIHNRNNKVINKATRAGGEIDKIIKSTLIRNGLEPKEVYKVVDIITADGGGLNNKILYLEDKNGEIKSYGVGNPINKIQYDKGESIQLENVLRNSVTLLEKACKNIEKTLGNFN